MNLWYIVTFVTLVVAIYISYYYRYPKTVNIIQSTLDHFNLSLLLEKQPVIVQDPIADLNQLHQAWFKWNRCSPLTVHSDQWFMNPYKFLVVCPTERTEMVLYPAGSPIVNGEPSPDQTILAVRLGAGQTLIVPFHWYIFTNSFEGDALGVHDAVTSVLAAF